MPAKKSVSPFGLSKYIPWQTSFIYRGVRRLKRTRAVRTRWPRVWPFGLLSSGLSLPSLPGRVFPSLASLAQRDMPAVADVETRRRVGVGAAP